MLPFSYGTMEDCEFGDFSPIQCLTGWVPEIIPLQYATNFHDVIYFREIEIYLSPVKLIHGHCRRRPGEGSGSDPLLKRKMYYGPEPCEQTMKN